MGSEVRGKLAATTICTLANFPTTALTVREAKVRLKLKLKSLRTKKNVSMLNVADDPVLWLTWRVHLIKRWFTIHRAAGTGPTVNG